MAIYHCSVKAISRSTGGSATAAAAYRAGCRIEDPRTGEVHDYRRRGGVVSEELVLPPGAPAWAADREALWGRAELAERRRNATVAREVVLALPAELSADARQRLAHDFALEIVARHGCVADVCIHAPSPRGDQRNWHAHILLTTRVLMTDGYGPKTRELDNRRTGPAIVTQWRERWSGLCNAALSAAGLAARVDHRSLRDQGVERAPGVHVGRAATWMRRRGEASHRAAVAAEVAALAQVIEALEREQAAQAAAAPTPAPRPARAARQEAARDEPRRRDEPAAQPADDWWTRRPARARRPIAPAPEPDRSPIALWREMVTDAARRRAELERRQAEAEQRHEQPPDDQPPDEPVPAPDGDPVPGVL